MKINKIEKMLKEESESINIDLPNYVRDVPLEKKMEENKELVFKKKIRMMPLLASAVSLLLVIGVVFGVFGSSFFTSSNSSLLTSFIVEINPAFCVTIDSDDNVVGITALNEDANTVIQDNRIINSIGKNIDECLSNLIDIVKEDGFFNENLKQVVISGFNDNRTQLKKKMDMFTDDFNRIMKEKGFGDINYQSNMLGFDSFMDRMDLPPEGPRKLDDMKDNFQGVRPFGDKPPKEPR